MPKRQHARLGDDCAVCGRRLATSGTHTGICYHCAAQLYTAHLADLQVRFELGEINQADRDDLAADLYDQVYGGGL